MNEHMETINKRVEKAKKNDYDMPTMRNQLMPPISKRMLPVARHCGNSPRFGTDSGIQSQFGKWKESRPADAWAVRLKAEIERLKGLICQQQQRKSGNQLNQYLARAEKGIGMSGGMEEMARCNGKKPGIITGK